MASKRTIAITLIISIVTIAFLAASVQAATEVTCNVTVKFDLSGITNYSSKILTIDGTKYTVSDLSWKTFQWASGSTHKITAYGSIRNTDNPSLNYTFASWTNGNGLETSTGTFITPKSSVTVTANYILATHTVKFDIKGLTSYSGNILKIDGKTYTVSNLNGKIFAWDVGTVHTVEAVTPVINTDYPKKTYTLQSWSSGSGLTGTGGKITMPNNDLAITANYGSDTHIVTFSVKGLTYYSSNIMRIDGTMYTYSTLESKTFAWEAGQIHTVEALTSIQNTEWPKKGYNFSSWTNGNGLTTESGKFIMPSSDVNVVANYVQSTVKVTFSTHGLSNINSGTILTIDGKSYSIWNIPDIEVQWGIGSTHTITAVNSIKGGDGVTYTFSSWTNGNGLVKASGTFTTPSKDVVVTVNYVSQVATPTPTPTPTSTPTKPATTLTISCVNSTADRGTKVTISGALTSRNCGIQCKTITLSYFNGASWCVISQTTTGCGGAYSYSWTIPQDVVNGQYPLKAEFAGDCSYQGTSAMTGTLGNGGSLFVVPEVGGALGALGACIGSTLVYGKLRSKRGGKA